MEIYRAPVAFIVEDDPVQGFITAEILRRHGYDAHAFTDPTRALLKCDDLEPSILICDVFMPGDMTGIDLAVKIKRVHPDARVLILSGSTEIDDLIGEAHSKGYIFPYLTKPVYPAALMEAIKKLKL